MAGTLEKFEIVGVPVASNTFSVGADYTGTGTVSTDRKLNYAAQGVADTLNTVSALSAVPFPLLSAGSAALAAVAYLAAFGTNTAVLGDDLNNPTTSGTEKSVSVVGDIITEFGDILGHWASLASFVSKTVAIPYQVTADVLSITGATISGITIENNVIPPFVNKYLGTAQSAAANVQSLVSQYGSQVNSYFGAAGAAFVSDLTGVLTSGLTALNDFGTQSFLSDANTFYSKVTQLEKDAANLFSSLGPTNTTLTSTTAGAGGVSFSDNTGVLAGTGLVGPVSPDGFGVPSLSGSFTLSDSTTGQFASVSGTQLLATDGVATISTTASSVGTESQTTQFGLSGPLSQATNLNGVTILSPFSTPAVISTSASGNVSVSIPSATSADNVTIIQNTDNSVQISVGDPQDVLEYAPGGLIGDTIDVSNANGMVSITTDLGASDTSIIVSDDNISGVVQDFQFGTPNGVLEIDDPVSFYGTITNFLPGDAIQLVGISIQSATIVSSGVMVVTESDGSTLSLQLDPSLDYSGYQLVTDYDEITAEPVLTSSGVQSVTVDAAVYDIQSNSTVTYTASVGLAPADLNFAAERTDDLWDQTVPVVATFGGGSLDPNAGPDSVYVYNSSSNASDFFITQGLTSGLGPDTTSGTIYVGSDYNSPGDYQEELPVSASYDGSTADVNLAASEKIYAPAVAALSVNGTAGVYDFGAIHVGQSASVAVEITNTATGALTDVLESSPGTIGEFTAENAIGDIGPENVGTVTVGLDPQIAGYTDVGPELFGLVSHDNDLPDQAAATGALSIAAEVYNYANPALTTSDPGSGTLSEVGNNWTLDFGIINLAGTLPYDTGAVIDIANQAPAYYSDWVDGTAVATGGGFGTDNVQSVISDIYGGSSGLLGTFNPDLTQAGTHVETIVFQPESSDPSGNTTLPDETLTVEDIVTDFAPSISPKGTLTLSGTLSNIAQHDWIAVNLVANQAYEVTVNGLSSEANVEVRDATGTDTPIGYNQTISGDLTAANDYTYFMPSTSGTYYIDVADPFAATPEAYTVSVAAVTADYTDNPSNPGTVSVGGSTSGTLSNIAQHDWIAVNLVANQAYEVTVNGLSSEANVEVQDATGTDTPIGYNQTISGDLTAASNYTYFMPSTSGTYYIDVADPFAATPEAYTVSVAAVTADYTDNPSNPGTVSVGGSTSGTLSNIAQHDWIAVNLVANRAYEVTVSGLSSEANVEVQDATGTDTPIGYNQTISGDLTAASNYTYFMPSTSGTYYIDVADPFAATPEAYTVSVAAVTADYTDNPSNPGTVSVGGSTSGTLSNIAQHDWIAVNLVANRAYEVTVSGLSSEANVEVQDATGTDTPIGYNQTISGDLTAASNYTYFMPSTSGTYYIDVADPFAATPEAYTVSVAAVTADYTDNPSNPGTVSVGGSTSGTLSNIAQHDWIAVNLVANQAYEVTVNGLSSEANVEVQDATGTDTPIGYNQTISGDLTAASNYTYFMPSTSGTYYIDVADPFAATPEAYTVSVAAVTADYTDNPATAGLVNTGGGIQTVAVGATIEPFADLNITDLSNQAETVTIQPSDAGNGVFSNLGDGTYNAATGQYSVSGPASTVTATLDDLAFTPTVLLAQNGQPALTSFQIAVVDAGGATAYDTSISVEAIACFASGTHIDTVRGAVAVERLEVGDQALCVFNDKADVIWIGTRRVDCRHHPDPRKVWPVRIAAGAFSECVPRRDLWLSPDHAVFVEDVLIPIKHLINGTTILQMEEDEVTYYHVELAQHDVVLAEGLPAESYLDSGDRSNFENGGEVIRLFPDFSIPALSIASVWEAMGCAPLVVYGPVLGMVRRKLERRACLVSRGEPSEHPVLTAV